jgi:hypothetical protein
LLLPHLVFHHCPSAQHMVCYEPCKKICMNSNCQSYIRLAIFTFRLLETERNERKLLHNLQLLPGRTFFGVLFSAAHKDLFFNTKSYIIWKLGTNFFSSQ